MGQARAQQEAVHSTRRLLVHAWRYIKKRLSPPVRGSVLGLAVAIWGLMR